MSILFASCTSNKYKTESYYGLKTYKVIYNATRNAVVGETMFLRDLGDVGIMLHEYGHILHDFHLKPNDELIYLLEKEYPIPPVITPSYRNRELQDFITTTTRWKMEYSFKHKKDCNIVNELMANLFVIFTLEGEELRYVKQNYYEIYTEYSKYYKSLNKNKRK